MSVSFTTCNFFTNWFSMDNVMAAINNSEGLCFVANAAFMFDPQAKRLQLKCRIIKALVKLKSER